MTQHRQRIARPPHQPLRSQHQRHPEAQSRAASAIKFSLRPHSPPHNAAGRELPHARSRQRAGLWWSRVAVPFS
eukprot:203004-Rhodomonas_salina.1